MHGRKATSRGFTLPELMVVVVLIVLLVAVLMPVLTGAFAYQRYTACTNNLHNLGVAYGTLYATKRRSNQISIGLLGSGWTAALSPYLSGDKTSFWCPAEPEGGVPKPASLDDFYDEVYIGSNYQGTVSLGRDDGVFIWRMSQTQFDQLAGTSGHGKNYNYTGYVPDSNPNVYWFVAEDMAWQTAPDKDFWDIMFKLETDGINTTITVKRGQTGYIHNFYYMKGGTREDIWRDCRNYDGESIVVKGVGAATYGVNTVVERIPPATGNKILILDYQHITAACSQYDETGERAYQLANTWIPDPNNPSNGPRFARHYKKANAVFTDGSVKLMPISDIHPEIIDNCIKYWDPKTGS